MPRNKKSKLAKKRDNYNSSYWRRKADIAWAKAVKLNQTCVICGATEQLNAHHLIDRNVPATRFSVENGITLCPKHHKFNFRLSAHRGSPAFFAWLMVNRPEQWNWVLAHVNDEPSGATYYDHYVRLNAITESGEK